MQVHRHGDNLYEFIGGDAGDQLLDALKKLLAEASVSSRAAFLKKLLALTGQ